MERMQERAETVLNTLRLQKKMNKDEVQKLLGISESSARRLFIEMEHSGKVVRTHGGIRLVANKGPLYSFDEVESRNLAEKQLIASVAANLIGDDDILYFDSGTTLLQLSIAIKEKLQNNQLKRIRVITNSLANLQVLHEVCDVILIGGEFRSKRKDFAGYAAERFVQNFNYQKAFLGTDGFDFAEGFMATDTDTAKLNEIVIKRSEKCYVMLDYSKIGLRSFVSYADISEINAIITNDSMSSAIKAQCALVNLDVLFSQPSPADATLMD